MPAIRDRVWGGWAEQEPSQPQEQPVPVEKVEPDPVPPGVSPRVWGLVETLVKEQKRIKDGVGSGEDETG